MQRSEQEDFDNLGDMDFLELTASQEHLLMESISEVTSSSGNQISAATQMLFWDQLNVLLHSAVGFGQYNIELISEPREKYSDLLPGYTWNNCIMFN